MGPHSIVYDKKPTEHFRELELLTKSGLVAYLVLLLIGGTITIAGVPTAFTFMTGIQICQALVIAFILKDFIVYSIQGINKIQWLGSLHVWLDNKLFRFAVRSNRIIIRTFVQSISLAERQRVAGFPESRQVEIAETVVTRLSRNQSIFESLMRRGIFRSWIMYWIFLYGVLVFFFLGIAAFVKAYMHPEPSTHAIFASFVIVGFVHLLFSVLVGFNVLVITKRISKDLNQYFGQEIAAILRDELSHQ